MIFGVTSWRGDGGRPPPPVEALSSNPPADAFQDIRGQKPWREASFSIGETTLRLAVASGLGSARALMDALRAGQVSYDFVEVMACPADVPAAAVSPSTTGRTTPPSEGSVCTPWTRRAPSASPMKIPPSRPSTRNTWRHPCRGRPSPAPYRITSGRCNPHIT